MSQPTKFIKSTLPILGLVGLSSLHVQAETEPDVDQPSTNRVASEPVAQPDTPYDHTEASENSVEYSTSTDSSPTPDKMTSDDHTTNKESESPKPTDAVDSTSSPKAEDPKSTGDVTPTTPAKAEDPKSTGNVTPTTPAKAEDGVTPSRVGSEVTTTEETERKDKETTGHIDVYVNHSKVDDAIHYATSAGVVVNRTETVVEEGTGAVIEKKREDVKTYYHEKARELVRAADDYKTALYNHDVEKAETETKITKANSEMNNLAAKLNAKGLATVVYTKEYREEAVTEDKAALEAENNKPVTPSSTLQPIKVFNYTIPSAMLRKPEAPTVDFHYVDLRAKLSTDGRVSNSDNEVIAPTTKDGKEVIKALKNQTVLLSTTNEPLPMNRFDKIHNIIRYATIPTGLEFDASKTVSDENWKVEYNKDTREVTISATPRYLVKVNRHQTVNEGMIGGSMETSFAYEVPDIAVKVSEDNKQYGVVLETLINDEYIASTKSVVIETSQSDPEKHNVNRDGITIDGRSLLPGEENYYRLTWDFDHYKGVKVDVGMQEKGLSLYDFYPEKAVDFKGAIGDIIIYEKTATGELHPIATSQEDGSFNTNSDEDVTGVSWEIVESVDGIQQDGKAIKVSIQGANHKFYKEYVEAGKSLVVQIKSTTKVVDSDPNTSGGPYGDVAYSNTFYQNDFGNIYKSNSVNNHITKVSPMKDAVHSVSELTSLDLSKNPTATIETGSTFQYRAKGTTLPLGAIIRSYEIHDTFHDADQYDGVYLVESGKPIYFKEGTMLASRYQSGMVANTDITRYTNQIITRDVSTDINTDTGLTSGADNKLVHVAIQLDADFIRQIDFERTNLQLDTFLQVKRVKNEQKVSNTYREVINGHAFDSNSVKTNSSKNALDTVSDELSKFKSDQNTHNKKTLDLIKRGAELSKQGLDLLNNKLSGKEESKTISGEFLLTKQGIQSEKEALEYAKSLGIQNPTKVEKTKDGYLIKYTEKIVTKTIHTGRGGSGPVESPKPEQPNTNSKAEQPNTNGKAEQPKTNGKAEQPKTNGKAEQPKVNGKAEQPNTNSKAEQPKTNGKVGNQASNQLTGNVSEVDMLKSKLKDKEREIKDKEVELQQLLEKRTKEIDEVASRKLDEVIKRAKVEIEKARLEADMARLELAKVMMGQTQSSTPASTPVAYSSRPATYGSTQPVSYARQSQPSPKSTSEEKPKDDKKEEKKEEKKEVKKGLRIELFQVTSDEGIQKELARLGLSNYVVEIVQREVDSVIVELKKQEQQVNHTQTATHQQVSSLLRPKQNN